MGILSKWERIWHGDGGWMQHGAARGRPPVALQVGLRGFDAHRVKIRRFDAYNTAGECRGGDAKTKAPGDAKAG